MPAEQPHDATWIAWPHNHEDWPEKFEPIPDLRRNRPPHAAQNERVHILVQPKGNRFANDAAILSRNQSSMSPPPASHRPCLDETPARSSSEKSRETRNSKLETALVDFKFNAWAKYDNNALDDQLAHRSLPTNSNCSGFSMAFGENDAGEFQRFVLEGGSIDVNGAGSLLTTEECLLSEIQQRNPGFSRSAVETTLCNYLGVLDPLAQPAASPATTPTATSTTPPLLNPTTIPSASNPTSPTSTISP